MLIAVILISIIFLTMWTGFFSPNGWFFLAISWTHSRYFLQILLMKLSLDSNKFLRYVAHHGWWCQNWGFCYDKWHFYWHKYSAWAPRIVDHDLPHGKETEQDLKFRQTCMDIRLMKGFSEYHGCTLRVNIPGNN